MLLCEPEDVKKHVTSIWEQIEASYAEREARPDGRPRKTPAELMLSPEEVERELAGAVVLEELAIEDQASPKPQALSLHVSNQPTASFHGRIQDWVADVRAAQERGDVVLFVAGSHGRAERTVELLGDYDVRAVMASDAGDGGGRRGDCRRGRAVARIQAARGRD